MKRIFSSVSQPDAPSRREIEASIEKRLFIGRLPSGTTEEDLRIAFSPYGKLTECRTLSDKGVGFVGFETWRAAHQALVANDNQACLPNAPTQTIAVFFAEKTARSGQSGRSFFAKGCENSRVFVGNLPETYDDLDLRRLFEVYGTVEAANMLPNKSRSSKRCGFVNFSIWGEAMDSMVELDGKHIAGGPEAVSVVLAEPREGSKSRRLDGWESGYQGGSGSTIEALKAAYIAAIDSDAAADVCHELHAKIMTARAALHTPRKLIAPSLSQSGGGSSSIGADDARLFVGGLPHEVIDEDLLSLVEQVKFSNLPRSQCQITECRVLPGRGCGYVRYSSWEAATQALQALNERQVTGWQQPLRVKWATPKGSEGAGPPASDPLKNLIQPPERLVSAALQSIMNGGGPRPTSIHAEYLSKDSKAEEDALIAKGLDPKRLFVGQLSRDLRDKGRLHEVFEHYGSIDNIRWLEDKGICYVQYLSYHAADAALNGLNGQYVKGVTRTEGFNITFSKTR